ncbi:DegV family protein [Mesobacillus subterraneus]|jgi:DegV family protein with EDD domain|uniref:DegV family protein n=1 Tax=Mesobacillus subterraneus TaxID=285983 RepID=UPI00203F7847|nr:DegV family protein [Mesobacillus subterraneus]MCM3662799.1 DegV family protein [Mesobacillus subterraneus]MCM3683025.1 DegV family protein [Mesobacillus subterraneus]
MTTQKDIAWITDSTASLSDDFIRNNNIYVVPLSIIFGEESYLEGVDITAEDFYPKLAASKVLPKTSQPAIGEFVELYQKLKAEYKHAIAIHASSALTGTYQSSVAASSMVDYKVEVIDSKIGSYPLGRMIEKGIEMQKAGKSYEEIVSLLRTLPDKANLYMAPGSLEQLHKGGRLSTTQVIIGSLIKLKLIVRFEDGKVVLFDKIRTEKKVKERLFQILEEASSNIKEASVIHGNVGSIAEEWREELQQRFPQISFSTTIFSPVPGTHTGQGTIGLAWISE